MKTSFIIIYHLLSKVSKKLKFISVSGLKLLTISLVLSCTSQSFANNESEYSGFDSIVRELSSTYSESPVVNRATAIETIKFHAGLGLVSSLVNLNLPKSLPQSKSMKGMELRLGIDLFDPKWVAEGAVRTFTPESFSTGEIALKEFDLLVVYKSSIHRPLSYTFGGGMTSRYLDIRGLSESGFDKSNITPASVILTGLSTAFSNSVTAGATISYRNALISKSTDEGSFDGTLQISGHF